jgi:uncharacterized protein (TIGR00645 family)
MRRLEKFLESVIFNSRWLIAPFYLGLVAGLGVLLVKFAQELWHLLPQTFASTESQVILAVLTLVDMSLIANLMLIIIFSGYENFVSKIDTGDHVDRPEWMGKVDFSGLKLKLIGSIVAISGIELLKAFMSVNQLSNQQLGWRVGIHLTFVVSGVLFALMDRISEGGHGHGGGGAAATDGAKTVAVPQKHSLN